jgi:uncharacterized protein YndB with AHSA1/START domain
VTIRDEVVRTTTQVGAPPERVFRALTDPRELERWWGSDDTYRTRDWSVDVREGGEWRATTIDSDGQEGSLAGEFRRVEPPHVLESTWTTSWDDAPSIVRYDLEPEEVNGAPGTRLTVTHTGPTHGAIACAGVAQALVRLPRTTRDSRPWRRFTPRMSSSGRAAESGRTTFSPGSSWTASSSSARRSTTMSRT